MDERELAPEEAFPSPRALLRRPAKRALRWLDRRLLDGRSRLICLVVGIPSVLAVSFGVAGLVSTPRSEPVDAALLAEAKRLDLDYAAVAAAPHQFAGKPVLWCLINDLQTGRYVVGGNVSWPVEIAGPSLLPMATARMGRCRETLAVVEERGEYGVRLRFAGHP